MNKIEQVKTLLESGYNCGQAIMAAFAWECGISRELALKISLNLGGGCAFRGEICGAVSATLLIYGIKFGTDRPNDELNEEIVYHYSSEYVREFTSIHGSIRCRELLGHDLSNPDGFARIMEDGLFKLKCSRFVLDSARILEQKLNETNKRIGL